MALRSAILTCVAAITLATALGAEPVLKQITDHPTIDSKGDYTGTVTLYFAVEKDINECFGWDPNSSEPLLPFMSLIEIAKAKAERPKSSSPYLPPKLVGADLRSLDRLWYWEIHVLFSLDFDKFGEIAPRGGEVYRSVKLLPNGGLIHIRERPMTAEERINCGLDEGPNPNAKDPFAPDP